ncbi:GPO family capsid scaffolding protein [Oceanobacter sp. 4_MG-2023]|uniref:GPO family capsid scaffolding protein n=1 Tax=Oceanobacter sp. 4_MG-2023 TaxID=3062623 RepID=UPI0027372244|nr:GPO family capsid scaffolding protein [Oceanobacter sp. 4_MG-2023]MDP2548889.1 GPO family capsid scaffolding protein [Oceanobacter sp. 4_MG-2023]
MLLTEWLTIGTAGATIDGREIPEDWLTAAAEQYDLDVYTAVINSDHELEWYGSFGTVQELRTGKNKQGKTTLEARINPNQRLVQMNVTGQKLFFSMEIIPEFADTGGAYLTGLAVTDRPASLGTSAMKFSSNKPALYSAAQPLELKLPDTNTNTTAPGWFTNWLKTFAPAPKKPEQDDDDMTPEQLAELKTALTDAVTTQSEQFTSALTELKTALTPADPATPPADTDTPPADTDTPPADQFSALTDALAKIQADQQSLADQFTALKSTPAPGVTMPAMTGPADDEITDDIC